MVDIRLLNIIKLSCIVNFENSVVSSFSYVRLISKYNNDSCKIHHIVKERVSIKNTIPDQGQCILRKYSQLKDTVY